MRRLTVTLVVLALTLGSGGTLAAEPAAGTFGPAGSLAVGRVSHSATLLRDERVLIIGGFGVDGDFDTATFASAEVWDPASASFAPAGSLAEARLSHTATPLPDGRVLVVGGLGRNDFQSLASAEVWEPSDG